MAKRTRSNRPKAAPPASRAAAPPAEATADIDASTAATEAPAATVDDAPSPTPAPAPAAAAAPRRRFWHDFEVSWAKWAVFRFVFFGLHAVDAFLQIAHAPRYGAGGFNVQQLPGALLPHPSRGGMTFVYGALCVLFALVAQGTAVRWALPAATALYGYAYFVSQLDSYQHHYLMWLVLVLLCFVPVRPTPDTAAPAAPSRLRAWSLRLLLVQLAIVYVWAAIAKVDPAWLDGTALSRQVQPGWVRDVVESLGFATVAIGVLAVEAIVAATLWWRPGWWVALPLGVGLHTGIELVGLDIGLFSYFMQAIYLLVLPDAFFVALVDRLGAAARGFTRIPVGLRVAASGLVLVAAIALVFAHPLPLGAVGVLAIVVTLAVAVPSLADRAALARRLRAVAVAVALLAVLLHTTRIPADHFRTWAGASRRMALPEERAAYQGLLAVDPTSEYGHYYLAQLDLRAGDTAAGLAHLRAAQRGAPRRARAYVAEVAVHLAARDRAAAQDALARGLAADPKSPELLTRKAALDAEPAP